MTRLLFAIGLIGYAVMGLTAVSAAGQTPLRDDAAKLKFQQIISAQIEAFRRDDADNAFSFAAPNIQSKFGTARRFIEMVKRHYQPVYRPRQVSFGPAKADNNGFIQAVNLIGPQGKFWTAVYRMERQPDLTWRIAGVTLLMRGGESA